MKVGLLQFFSWTGRIPVSTVYERAMDRVAMMDDSAYDCIWLAEHHFSPYGILADLPLVAAAIAAQTERIRIGTACMVAPFHNPVRIAERIAMVDVLSGGRFDAGFGRGYQAHEFKGFGIPMDEATARYTEAVEIVNQLLTQESVSYRESTSRFRTSRSIPAPFRIRCRSGER